MRALKHFELLENAARFSVSKTKVKFLLFLNVGAQIRCPQNRDTDLKSALDQPLITAWFYSQNNGCISKHSIFQIQV